MKRMSLLKSLWGAAGGGGDGGGSKALAVPSSSGDSQWKSAGMSYARVTSSSSSGKRPSSKRVDRREGVAHSHNQPPLAGAKRPRSPAEKSCRRCFRTTNKTAECRHQIVCLRCACVGHMAARCPVPGDVEEESAKEEGAREV